MNINQIKKIKSIFVFITYICITCYAYTNNAIKVNKTDNSFLSPVSIIANKTDKNEINTKIINSIEKLPFFLQSILNSEEIPLDLIETWIHKQQPDILFLPRIQSNTPEESDNLIKNLFLNPTISQDELKNIRKNREINSHTDIAILFLEQQIEKLSPNEQIGEIGKEVIHLRNLLNINLSTNIILINDTPFSLVKDSTQYNAAFQALYPTTSNISLKHLTTPSKEFKLKEPLTQKHILQAVITYIENRSLSFEPEQPPYIPQEFRLLTKEDKKELLALLEISITDENNNTDAISKLMIFFQKWIISEEEYQKIKEKKEKLKKKKLLKQFSQQRNKHTDSNTTLNHKGKKSEKKSTTKYLKQQLSSLKELFMQLKLLLKYEEFLFMTIKGSDLKKSRYGSLIKSRDHRVKISNKVQEQEIASEKAMKNYTSSITQYTNALTKFAASHLNEENKETGLPKRTGLSFSVIANILTLQENLLTYKTKISGLNNSISILEKFMKKYKRNIEYSKPYIDIMKSSMTTLSNTHQKSA